MTHLLWSWGRVTPGKIYTSPRWISRGCLRGVQRKWLYSWELSPWGVPFQTLTYIKIIEWWSLVYLFLFPDIKICLHFCPTWKHLFPRQWAGWRAKAIHFCYSWHLSMSLTQKKTLGCLMEERIFGRYQMYLEKCLSNFFIKISL